MKKVWWKSLLILLPGEMKISNDKEKSSKNSSNKEESSEKKGIMYGYFLGFSKCI